MFEVDIKPDIAKCWERLVLPLILVFTFVFTKYLYSRSFFFFFSSSMYASLYANSPSVQQYNDVNVHNSLWPPQCKYRIFKCRWKKKQSWINWHLSGAVSPDENSTSVNTPLPSLGRYTTSIPTFSRGSPSYSNVSGAHGYLPPSAESALWSTPGSNYPNTDGSISYVNMSVSSRNRSSGQPLPAPFSAAASLSARKYYNFYIGPNHGVDLKRKRDWTASFSV